MYAIDFNTATAIEIIERSIVCHPSLFTEALEARRSEDMRYAATREDRTVKKAVTASANATARAIHFVDTESPQAFKDDMGAGIIALNIACKLQCIPAYVRTAAALRTWESEL